MAKSAIAQALEELKEKLVGASVTELPEVSGSDNGKALIVSGGKWDKGSIPAELPAVSGSDNGKALIVSEGAWAAGDLPVELPAVTDADVGKVLTVDAEGHWVAAALPGT